MDFKSLLKPLFKNSINVTLNDNDFQCPIGCSKVGGKPDLPLGFEWFYYEGESYDGVIKNRPLSFLAQIDCQAIKKYDLDNLLPDKGFLYFFYEIQSMTWGFDPNDKGSAKIFYFPGDVVDLHRLDFPDDLAEDSRLPEISISFSSIPSLPDFDELMELNKNIDYKDFDAYSAARDGLIQKYEKDLGYKLLGYADLIQIGMLMKCELTTKGIYTGDATINISNTDMENCKNNCSKWQLLFQINSFEYKNFELLWGDCGMIYYYINTNDLLKLDFDNSWLILQCT